MTKLITTLIFVLLLITSCRQNEEAIQKYFAHENFPQSSKLIGENMEFLTEGNPVRFYVLKDSLILVQNKSAIDDYFFDIYNLNTKAKIFSFAKKGKGPNEFLSPTINYIEENHDFWIKDYSFKALTKVNIDSLLQLKEDYLLKKVTFPTEAIQIHKINNKFLCYNRWYIESEEFSNKVNMLFTFPYDTNTVKLYPVDRSIYPANVNGARIYYSEKNKRIVLTGQRENYIDIYDLDSNKIISLIGPYNYELQYELTPIALLFKDKTWMAYYHLGYVTNKNLYLIHSAVNNVEKEDQYNMPSEIFKIDWNGNLIAHYQLDRHIITITLNSKEDIVYATEYVHEDFPRLIKFKI